MDTLYDIVVSHLYDTTEREKYVLNKTDIVKFYVGNPDPGSKSAGGGYL